MNRFGILNLKTIYRCLFTGMVLYSSNCFFKNLNVDEPIKISKGTFDSLVESDNSFSNLSMCSIDDKDFDIYKNVSLKNLKSVESVDFDALNSDVNDLFYMENLKKINFSNFMALDVNDVDLINKLNLGEYVINLNHQDFNKIVNFDFSKFENCNFILNFENLNFEKNDMMDLYYYNVVKNLNELYPNVSFCVSNFEEDKLAKCRRLDDRINEIITSFDFDENTTDYEKILQILFYVNGNLEYDKNVSNFLSLNVAVTEDMHNLYLNYSSNLIGNFLDDNNKNSICCNYSALVSTLAYYSNLDLSYNYGTLGDSLNNGHSWCEYSDSCSDYIVDPTSLDSNVYFDMYRCVTGMNIDNLNIDDYFNSSNAYDVVLSTNYDRYNNVGCIDFIDNSNLEFNKSLEYINEDGNLYYHESLKSANLCFGMGVFCLLSLLFDFKLSNKKSKKYCLKKYN